MNTCKVHIRRIVNVLALTSLPLLAACLGSPSGQSGAVGHGPAREGAASEEERSAQSSSNEESPASAPFSGVAGSPGSSGVAGSPGIGTTTGFDTTPGAMSSLQDAGTFDTRCGSGALRISDLDYTEVVADPAEIYDGSVAYVGAVGDPADMRMALAVSGVGVGVNLGTPELRDCRFYFRASLPPDVTGGSVLARFRVVPFAPIDAIVGGPRWDEALSNELTKTVYLGAAPDAAMDAGLVDAAPDGARGDEDAGVDGPSHGPDPTLESTSGAGIYHVVALQEDLDTGGEDLGVTTLYYPDGSIEPAPAGPYPYVVLNVGFAPAPTYGVRWGEFLASHGFVVLTHGTTPLAGDLGTRVNELQAARATLLREHADPASPLYGMLAVGRDAAIARLDAGPGTLALAELAEPPRAVVSACPIAPDAMLRFASAASPALVLAAENETLAPPATYARPFYDSVPASVGKTYLELAERACAATPLLPEDASGGVGRHVLSWLKYYLEDDERYLPFLQTAPSGVSEFDTTLD